MPQFSEAQIEDIKAREAKALDVLKELQLTPSAMPQLVNLGDDVFGIKIHPFLNDTKYSQPSVVSPIQDIEPPENTSA